MAGMSRREIEEDRIDRSNTKLFPPSSSINSNRVGDTTTIRGSAAGLVPFGNRPKDVLKTADNYGKLAGDACFLNIKALDKIISEPKWRRAVGRRVRWRARAKARRYSLHHYRDLIMSSSFDSLNLTVARSPSHPPRQIPPVNIF